MGLDYDSTVMLTCKLLFAAAKVTVDVGPHMPRQLYLLDFFFVQDQGGGAFPPQTFKLAPQTDCYYYFNLVKKDGWRMSA